MTLAGLAAVIEGGQQLPFNDPFTCFLLGPADLLQPQVQVATPDSQSGLPLSQILPQFGKTTGVTKSDGGYVGKEQRAETKPGTSKQSQRNQRPERDTKKQKLI